ncbi:MAG TPA: TonB-dependent receptor [Bryobacteraceae bacterium]|nr:TonB-dependent receptor [Bryobacteraceae bacterium]
MKGKLYLIATLLVLSAAGLRGQGDRGIITGTVKDASGAVVPGAHVTATQVATNTIYKADTTDSGDFTEAALPVGTYRVRVENTGFKTYIASDVVVAAGATVRLDVVMELGTTQQTIEVTGSAALLQAETARVATEVSNRLVNDLPLLVNGAVRSPFDLATTTAEVAGTGDSNLRVGGGRIGAYGMTLDGTAATVGRPDAQVSWSQINAPSVEALTEFSVESAGFKAETGHASGGTISFVSKSGTNEFHGDAYEFLRNQHLDARGFFAAQKAVYKQNDFGVTAGGPVLIPKLYNGRNRTFFFFSYEGFRNRIGASPVPYTVPPPEFFNGDLHNWVNSAGKMIQIYDPSTTTLVNGAYQRMPFPNNQIPQSQFDPVAKAIMGYAQPLVQPNVPGLVPGTSAYVRNNAISYGTSQFPNNKYSIKADQVLTSKQRIAFLFARTREQDLGGGASTPTLPYPLSGNPGYNRSDIYRLSYDYTLSPTWLNRFYAGGNNWRQNHGAYSTYKGAPQSDGIPTVSTGWKDKGICVPNWPDCNLNFPIEVFSDESTWGVGAPNGSDNIVVEFRDDMTKVHGAHTFKWGYYYNNTHYNGFGLSYIAGLENFSYLNTAMPLDTSQQTGSSFASFLLGQASGYRLDTNRYIAGQYRTHQMYFQDDWRVSSRLTLNLGLRYEINLAPIYGDDILSNFDPSVPNPGADGRLGALVFAGYGPGRQNTHTLAPNWYKGVGPRLGFAYALNSKTTLRGSATRSYGPVINPLGSTHYLGFVQQITVSTDPSLGLTPLFTLKGGAPYWAPVPQIDPSVANGNTNVPYYNGATATRESGELTYAFNIQRQIGSSMVAEIGYLGTLASDIQSSLLAYDQIPYRSLPPNLNPFTPAGRTLLTSQITSPAAVAAGITPPFAAFTKVFGTGATVGQALRPYPQYALIDTISGGGDRLGHSTYHSMMLKLSKRYSSGLTLQASYVLSKALTDSDNYNSTPSSMDAYNLRLEKSIAGFDQTHNVKLTYVYELPFGKGKRYLTRGVSSAVLGGWRVAGIQQYASGTPISIGTTVSFPIFNGTNRATVPTYDGWRAPIHGGSFDPNKDSFLQPASFFGPQPTTGFGNETRYNPKLRGWPNYNENFSLARSIPLKGEQQRLDFRWETFNLLNRTAFGPLSGATTLQNPNFGLWRTQSNTQRRMQVSLKLYW